MKPLDQSVIENYIALATERLQDFSIPSTSDYEILYEPIQKDNLREYLVMAHAVIVESYREMNRRITNSNLYYRSEDSQRLYTCINSLKELQGKLAKTAYSFQINEDYTEILNNTLNFIGNGGSQIPSDWPIVDIPLKIPLFFQTTTLEIKHTASKEYSNLTYVGEGAFAKVYKFYDDFLGRELAIKVANVELEEKDLKRFRGEYDNLSNLDSPYIIDVYSYDTEKNSYTMEFMPHNLVSYYNSQTPSFDIRRRIAFQVFSAAEYIVSKGKYHRDLSPNNVLIREFDDGSIVAKISDFGLVKDKDFKLTSYDSAPKGTFIPPEVLNGEVPFRLYGVKQEIYELTRLVFFILTGNLTNDSDSVPINIRKAYNIGANSNQDQRPNDVNTLRKLFLGK